MEVKCIDLLNKSSSRVGLIIRIKKIFRNKCYIDKITNINIILANKINDEKSHVWHGFATNFIKGITLAVGTVNIIHSLASVVSKKVLPVYNDRYYVTRFQSL